MASRHIAYIAFGSNLGDKAANCHRGIEAIGETEGCAIEAESPLYKTEPIYLESQDWFLNGVVKICTDLAPEHLLARLKQIEYEMGRRPGARFGPRILDLDILFYDDRVLRAGELEIPHPNLHERRFVLRPLCDIAPELMHPVIGRNIKSLLSDLNDGEKEVIIYKID